MTFVDDKINALAPEERSQFKEALAGILLDDKSTDKIPNWLVLRGFDVINGYSIDMVKLTLYREMFEGDSSYVHREEARVNQL